MTYWNLILAPLLEGETNLFNIFTILKEKTDLIISVRIGDDIIDTPEQYAENDSVWWCVTEVTLEAERTWILLECEKREVIFIEEENDRGEVTVIMDNRPDLEIFVSEEYGLNSLIWTPSVKTWEAAEKLFNDFVASAEGEYFLIFDPRIIDPEGKWVPIHMEFGEDEDCEGWWQDGEGNRVELPNNSYYAHVHEPDDTYIIDKSKEPEREEDDSSFEKMLLDFGFKPTKLSNGMTQWNKD